MISSPVAGSVYATKNCITLSATKIGTQTKYKRSQPSSCGLQGCAWGV